MFKSKNDNNIINLDTHMFFRTTFALVTYLSFQFRKCDTPLRTIESMYRHIASRHSDIDLIYWTGDLPPHDIWNQTRKELCLLADFEPTVNPDANSENSNALKCNLVLF